MEKWIAFYYVELASNENAIEELIRLYDEIDKTENRTKLIAEIF